MSFIYVILDYLKTSKDISSPVPVCVRLSYLIVSLKGYGRYLSVSVRCIFFTSEHKKYYFSIITRGKKE